MDVTFVPLTSVELHDNISYLSNSFLEQNRAGKCCMIVYDLPYMFRLRNHSVFDSGKPHRGPDVECPGGIPSICYYLTL